MSKALFFLTILGTGVVALGSWFECLSLRQLHQHEHFRLAPRSGAEQALTREGVRASRRSEWVLWAPESHAFFAATLAAGGSSRVSRSGTIAASSHAA